MKSQFFVSFLLALSGLCLASGSNPCSSGWTGFLPHASNCSLFYLCNQGYPNLLRCPENLHFNLEREACLYPEEAGCKEAATLPPGETPAPTQAPPTTQAPPATTSRAPEVTTAAPGTTAQPVPTTTTARPAPTTTTARPAPTTTTARPGGGDDVCPAGVEFIYLAHPSDCNKFILCRNGNNEGVYNCGAGLWFNQDFQVCSVPWGSSSR